MRNPRFNVLERYLAKKIGIRWDKVYSDICLNADSRSFQGAELRQAIPSLVALKCWIEDKKLLSNDWLGRKVEVKGFYVHPTSGLLQRR